MVRALIFAWFCVICGRMEVDAQVTQPLVAVHDSELTRALESMNAVAPTPTGPGTTGKQWWPTDWHYFVMPESVKEALRSDGTAFTVVGDSNITAGVLLLSNGQPKYPIVISLASEAIRDDEIAPFTNYVAAGGFLFAGSSAFSRNTNGTTRTDFAFANQMGIHSMNPSLQNWVLNTHVTKLVDHRLDAHFPSGLLTWRMPSSAEEIPWGISPDHPFIAPHDIWRVTNSDATILAQADNGPFLTVKQYGKGYFIYCSGFQPLVGHSGFAPSMYAYVIFRRAIEWAFESANLPIPKLSPWPYQYDAAFMVRHDLENFTNEIANIELSAGVEFTNGAKGDYYFCTGTLRDDASPTYNTNTIVAGLRRAVTNFGATIGPHNGGLKNPNNASLVRGQYDYWHWGTDEALDVTPAGYPSGKAYATASLSNSFRDVEGWLTGITNGIRSWVQCYFNGTREDSYDLQAQVGVNISGDQKISPFPHWTLSTLTPNKRYAYLTEPVSDWFVGGLVAQSLEPWHPPGIQTTNTMRAAIDFYYGLGALINFYSHTMATGLGDAGGLVPDYVAYCANTNLHPRTWGANGVMIYQWWLQRSNAQVAVSYNTNGNQSLLTLNISGSVSTNTAVEVVIPGTNQLCSIQVVTNGVLASTNVYRVTGQTLKLRVGNSVTNAIIGYYKLTPFSPVFAENFDDVSAPSLPLDWSTASSGSQSNWLTQSATNSTAPNSAFSPDATNAGVNELVSPAISMPAGMATLSFRHYYDLEPGVGGDAYDGGVLEIKIGANAFADIITAGGSFVTGGYLTNVNTGFGNPLAGRQVWTGNSGGFTQTIVNLPPSVSGQTIQLRWRCGSDNNNGRTGWWVDSVLVSSQMCLCCVTPNTAPVLPAQTNRTLAELTPLSVTNTASDSDVPANTLFYNLVSPPAGAGINSSGVIAWTPSEAQGPGVYTLTTIVTDSGFPPLTATNSFNVTVSEVNVAPGFVSTPANRTVNELVMMNVNDNATDPDLPANTLSYSFLASPAGATISSSGLISWTPAEVQGPGTNTFIVVVTDGSLSATNSFVVVVNEVNSVPVFLATPPNQTIVPQNTLSVANSATDSDIPTNALSYALLNPPAGASISSGGIITWVPTSGQNHTTNLFRTVVTDNGSPNLSATNAFIIIVNNDPVVALNSSTLAVEGCLPTNNVVDPGETVTVLFSLKNVGLGDATNLVVTLLQTNGIVAANGPQSYGVLLNGGAPVTQPFTFANTGSCGGLVTAVLQLQDGAKNLGTVSVPFALGQLSTIFTQNFDSVLAPALPSDWTTSAGGAQSSWRTSATNGFDTGTNAAFSVDAINIGSNELVSPNIVLPQGFAQLTFQNYYNLETGGGTNGFDGGVLEIKIGTNGFTDILAAGGTFVTNGYNTTIDGRFGNPFAGRQAWSGTNTSFIPTTVNLPASAAGQTNQFRWRCGTDNGVGGGGWRIDSVGILANVCCANGAPVLTAQTNRAIAELTPLVVNNAAADSSTPPGGLTYSLSSNAPAGAAIDNSGTITWTPSEAQGPGTYAITTIVSDNSYPPLSATNSFNVTVNEVNVAPVLSVPADQTLNELTTLNVSASATDSDLPTNTLTFSLMSPPSGMLINPNTGAISWIPSEGQGPSTNTITVVVTDNGSPNLSDTESFIVTVSEVNTAPVLTIPDNQTINELTTLNVSASATDPDLPTNTLAFSLVSAPSGMTINTNTGSISWTPTESQGPSTNTITVMVTDNGSPNLSDTKFFTVTVNDVNSAPVLTVPTNQVIDELTVLNVSASATDSDIPTNILTFRLLTPPAGMTINTNTGAITWTPAEDQGPSTNIITVIVTDDGSPNLSDTNTFTVTVNEVNQPPVLPFQSDRTINASSTMMVTNSATDPDLPANLISYSLLNPPDGATIDTNGVITWTAPSSSNLVADDFVTVATDNGIPPLSFTNRFNVTVIPPADPPLILSVRLTNGVTTVTWSSVPGHTYRLEYKDSLAASDWDFVLPSIAASGSATSATNAVGDKAQRFYRVTLLP